jgi:large subunit ribosomal protein L29
MAILHVKEIEKLKPAEMDKKIEDLKKELMRANTQIAQGTQPEKPGRVKEIKRTIARILTIKRRGVKTDHE